MPLLEITNVQKSYNGTFHISHVNLSVDKGRILALLGPSGCGKTSLLRIIAGLERADKGTIRFDGRDISRLPPHKRGFGMMFQEYALFPHKNVEENIAFGLRLQKLSPARIRSRTKQVLDLVGLAGFESRRIDDLSGGERQRVALARSLAPKPGLLMLDEPLGALDRNLRERLSSDLREILTAAGVTAVFVTHDQVEAFAVAHRVAVMDGGRILQIDTPENLYKHPENETVARFLGFQNRLPGTVQSNGGVCTSLGVFYPKPVNFPAGAQVTLVFRPESALLSTSKNSGISGHVTSRQFRGGLYRIRLQTPQGQSLVFHLPDHPNPPPEKMPIQLTVNPEGITVIRPGF